MSSPLYTDMKTGLEDVYTSLSHTQASTSSSTSRQLILTPEIKDRLQTLIDSLKPLQVTDGDPSVNVDLLRSVLDLLGRDLVVTPITTGEVNHPQSDKSNLSLYGTS